MFLHVDHIGVAVADLDVALGFYRDVLGFTVEHVEVNVEQGVREAMLVVGPVASSEGAVPGGSVGGWTGEASGSTEIQLLAPLTSDSVLAKFLNRSGPGVHHVAYAVDDVEADCTRLRARGLRVLWDHARPGTRGSRVNFVHPADAGGVLLELVQHVGHDAVPSASQLIQAEAS